MVGWHRGAVSPNSIDHSCPQIPNSGSIALASLRGELPPSGDVPDSAERVS
jgi:hypothetical protein